MSAKDMSKASRGQRIQQPSYRSCTHQPSIRVYQCRSFYNTLVKGLPVAVTFIVGFVHAELDLEIAKAQLRACWEVAVSVYAIGLQGRITG